MSTSGPMVSRRSFVERLGLGAGAALLAPIAGALVSEAHGQTPARKRVMFFVCGNGISPAFNFTPAELRANLDAPVMDGPRNFSWPAMVQPLEALRGRTLLVDGLANVERRSGNGHSMSYSALSCMPMGPGATANNETPGGITIDQMIANRIGTTTARKSVLIGVGGPSGAQYRKVFASDRGKPEAFMQEPQRLFADLFGEVASDPAAGAARRRALLDSLRFDIKRLASAVAAPEREKLDGYLVQLEDLDRRQSALAAAGCRPGAVPPAGGLKIEDRLSALHDIATTALVCGMTNVVGVSNCTGNPHSFFPTWSKIVAGTSVPAFDGGIGHSPGSAQGPAMDLFHAFNAGLIARTVAALSAVKEGDGTAFDNTVIVYLSDNGEAHHASHHRWPLVVVGTAGGKLRADGRFLRYPKKGASGWRSMADFFCTIATACGAPTSDFGKGGNEPVQGPLADLMA